ncbi:MAG: MBOAT family protein [Eubacterium sp.]|nr:MBOAT family protein [Eubacterium sp.]
MVFSSAIFLFAFLPIVFGLCLLPIPLRAKNVILIIGSLFFYAFGEPVYVFLMLASSIVNYTFGRLLGMSSIKKLDIDIEKEEVKKYVGIEKVKTPYRKLLLTLAVIINIGTLGVFKYTDFVLDSINKGFKLSIPLPGIALPIGISFFTFQALSYVIDVYRNPKQEQKSYPAVLLYISMFPQLVAGPIVKYSDVEYQIYNREHTTDEIVGGIERFCKGLFKKMFIANIMGSIADQIFALNISEYSVLVAWLGAISYALQIFFDFSAYSDMALGLGHMFGFTFKENFLHPYSAVSITDFWDRWHVSLSSWFKEYVYVPLGGNRKGRARTEINKLIVFLLTGIWHGANWTFILWGMIHGIANVLEDTILPINKLKGKKKIFGNIYTVLIAVIAFVFFRADTIGYGLKFVKQMFTGFFLDAPSISIFLEQMNVYNIITLILAMIFAYPVKDKICKKINKPGFYAVFAILALALCILRLSSASYNPFIYFRF